MSPGLERLLPRPRTLVEHPEVLTLDADRPLAVAAPLAWQQALERFLPGLPLEASGPTEALVRVSVDPALTSLRIEVNPRGISVSTPKELLFPSAATVAQLFRLAEGGRMPCCRIEDAPALERRGYMLDVSRDRVPTMDELRALIDLLGSLKYDHLQLYVEHTFAYAGHEEVWAEASPLTPSEIRELDAWASGVGVELAANQNCFGHMHRWLTLPRYAPLAECPEGIEHAFSVTKEPFSLCPQDPGSLALVEDLLDQLMPCFRSPVVNVGLDETFDLGEGRSREHCESKGKGVVYLEYLEEVHKRVTERGGRTQFWGDIIVQHPDLVPRLPRDATALEWGYEAGHPFQEHAALFAASGLPFWVVPGTSTWQSMLGRIDNMEANVREAIRAAVDHGARGMLMTDWGDFGHWQPPCTAWPGIVAAAAEAWNPGSMPSDLSEAIDWLVPASQGAGSGLVALGRAHRALCSPAVNGTAAFFHLRYAHAAEVERAPELSIAGCEAHEAALREALTLLPGRGACRTELEAAAAIASFGTRLARARLEAEMAPLEELPEPVRQDLRSSAVDAATQHRHAWLIRSRPGGLRESAGRLEALAQRLA